MAVVSQERFHCIHSLMTIYLKFAAVYLCHICHFQGTYLVSQAVARLMLKNKIQNGSIINISSIAGKVNKMYQLRILYMAGKVCRNYPVILNQCLFL